MMRSGFNGAGDGARPRPGGRSASDDSLVREVQWRLFRREDLPARLRRLERLEKVAESERRKQERDRAEPG